MKLLNEANLVYFSTCSSHTTKEGWLSKRGEINKSFQKRWFVLKGNLLFYFEKPGDKEPNGVIVLEGYTVELVSTSGITDGYNFQIVFNGSSSNRKYVLQAESGHVMEDWMKAITCASYDYMKIMVAGLKAELDELTAQELSNELRDCKVQTGDTSHAFRDPQVTTSNPVSSTSKNEASATALHTTPNQRFNPFQRNRGYLDPFGQVPFESEISSRQPGNSSNLELPKAPNRKKYKNSPKQSRKNQTKNDAILTHESQSGGAQFYADAGAYYPNSHMKPRRSSFAQLHDQYREKIYAVIKKTTPDRQVVGATDENSASLIAL